MKKVILLICLVFVTRTVVATLIIIIKKDKTIYVGADSRSTVYAMTSSGKLDTIYKSICKINLSNKIYFAVGGFNDSLLTANAKIACAHAQSVEQAAKNFANLTQQSQYIQGMEFFRRHRPEDYKRRFTGNNVGSVAFFNIENGMPKLVDVWFIIKNLATEPTKLEFNYSEDPVIVLGDMKVLENYKGPLDPDPIKMISNGIEFGIKNNPTHIGYPVDLLILDKNGAKWIAKKKECN